MVLPTIHRPAALPAPVGLPQASLGSGRGGCVMGQAWGTVSSQASCRRSQPKCLKGKAGEDLPILPAPWASHPPALDQRHEGGRRPGWGPRTRQPGLVFLLPTVPAGHLPEHYVHLQHFGGGRHNTPDQSFTRAVGANVWARGRQVLGCKPPQLGLVPVTSAKPPLSSCHSPIVTQRLKANAVPATPSPAR